MRCTMNTPESVIAPGVMTWLYGFRAAASGDCRRPDAARDVSWRTGAGTAACRAGAAAWEHAATPRAPNARRMLKERIDCTLVRVGNGEIRPCHAIRLVVSVC